MQKLYKSKYAQHLYGEEESTLYTDWFKETEYMTKEDFKIEMEAWLEASKKVNPKKIYDYCTNFIYPINPEEQVWMAHLLNPGWIQVGVKKYAHIVPEEFIANLSVEQMFEEFDKMNLDNQFEIRHFADNKSEEDKKWLFEE